MVSKNTIHEAMAEGYTSEGFGVCRVEGVAVFVPRAAKGDRLLVRIVKSHSHYAYGKIEEILTLSPVRAESLCPYFPACGGCDFWHLTYEEELRLKKQRVEDAFAHVGGFSLTLDNVVAAPSMKGYRNKALFPIVGQGVLGLYRARSHDLVPVTRCLLQSEPANQCLRAVSQYLTETNVPAFDPQTGKGLWRHLLIRVAEGTGQVHVGVIAAREQLPEPQRLTALLREACPAITGISVGANTRRDNVIMPAKFKPIWGTLLLEDTLCGLSFALSPDTFYQVNHAQAQRLFAEAARYAGEARSYLDLYCGAGVLTLIMAKGVSQAAGVEIHPPAVENARQNAARNGMEHVTFLCGDAASTDVGFRPEIITVDPPRRGLSAQALAAVLKHAPRRLVYISCDPGTLARDISLLSKAGFRPEDATMVDMFPRTANVECVVSLARSENSI